MSFLPAVNEGLLYVGASDRRNPYFENVYPIGRGASFNSYLYLDEKTALLDTADASVTEAFFSNVSSGLGGRNLDYLIVQHMEPDHAANIARVMAEYPACTVVCNDKVRKMISNFFGAQEESRFHIVKEGDKLPLGKRTLSFLFAPMVHWPEVMMTFEEREGVLFSADAFGTFGALSGNLFADEVNFAEEWLAEARRYYTNIVGKYGVQVQAVLKKAANLPIRTICPLHGPVWRKDLGFILEKYNRWSTYQCTGIPSARRNSSQKCWENAAFPSACTTFRGRTFPILSPRRSGSTASSSLLPPITAESSAPWNTLSRS